LLPQRLKKMLDNLPALGGAHTARNLQLVVGSGKLN
jgi:hypothetical protein